MIEISIDEGSLRVVQQRLAALPPGIIVQVQQALRPLLYESLRSSVQKYFTGPEPQGGPTGPILTSRRGALLQSVLDSLKVIAEGDVIKVSIGSKLRYAAIHEYGGYAGRRPPFKKENGRRPYIPPRPYLRPTISDLQQALPELLERAMQQVQLQ